MKHCEANKMLKPRDAFITHHSSRCAGAGGVKCIQQAFIWNTFIVIKQKQKSSASVGKEKTLELEMISLLFNQNET